MVVESDRRNRWIVSFIKASKNPPGLHRVNQARSNQKRRVRPNVRFRKPTSTDALKPLIELNQAYIPVYPSKIVTGKNRPFQSRWRALPIFNSIRVDN
jgi:hypothetical protein